jgi:hypothetical protein
VETNTPTTLLSDRTYSKLRLTVTILLPGLAALYFGLAEIWNFPNQAQVSGSIAVVTIFAGVLLNFARALYETSGAKYDGVMMIEPGEDGDQLRLKSVDYTSLDTKDQLVFKVRHARPSAGIAE